MKWLALLFLGLYATNALHVETENYEEYAEEHDQEENGLQDHDEEYGLQEHDDANPQKHPNGHPANGQNNRRKRRAHHRPPKALITACNTACKAATGIACNPKETICCKADKCDTRPNTQNKYCKGENRIDLNVTFQNKTRKC